MAEAENDFRMAKRICSALSARIPLQASAGVGTFRKLKVQKSLNFATSFTFCISSSCG